MKNFVATSLPTIFLIGDQKIEIQHSLQLTMVDCKICNALSDTSSAKCYICEATPTQKNNLNVCLQRKVRKERYEFGLSNCIRTYDFLSIFSKYHIDWKKNFGKHGLKKLRKTY